MTLKVGKGEFRWDDNTGRSNADKPLDVYYYRPDVVTADTPVWIIMHGSSRNADDYLHYFVDAAREQGAIVIAPEFDKADWPGSRSYNLGNVATSDAPGATPRQKQDWSFSKIEPLFDYVKTLEPTLQTEEYFMFGHSAGGQFVHRFLAWVPEARVKLAVAANPGWYTVADTDGSYPYSWPYSINEIPDYNPATQAYDSLPDLTDYLGDKLVVLLGDRDIRRTSNLRQTEEADGQGRNRFERGQYFFKEGQEEAKVRGVPFGWELEIVPGVDHDGEKMAIAAAKLFQQIPAPAPTPPTRLEAEDALLGTGVNVASNHEGFSGTGFADYPGSTGNDTFVEWSVDVATPGSYNLDFAYANGSAVDRPLEVSVNNTVVAPSLSFGSTSAWNNWGINSASVDLLAGTNTIKLTANSVRGPNIDYMELVQIPPTVV